MDRAEVIGLAREAGALIQPPNNLRGARFLLHEQHLERFAALVVARERETCAKLCDSLSQEAAEAIRARK